MSKIKLISVTWSYDDESNHKESFLYKSFIKKNDTSDIVNIHFNRNNYKKIEEEFNEKYGYQYEYILYKIFLLKEKLLGIDCDTVIYCDTSDVTVMKNIKQIKIEDEIIFSSEKHQYPTNISQWEGVNSYQNKNITERNYLNSGVIISSKKNYIDLIDSVIENVLSKDYKDFGGDQGVYTNHYLNNMTPKIKLDKDYEFSISTYLSSPNEYIIKNEQLINTSKNNSPYFIHDNGWDYGGSKFKEHFKL